MKRLLVIICAPAVLLLTCSKKSTNPPDDNNPPAEVVTSVSYTTVDSLAVQQAVSSATGGTIIASDAQGTQFELSIPPAALHSDATIEVTPLASLTLGGITGAVCAGCAGVDSLCCLRGILLEPAGLVLDSPAVLTIAFPPGQFPFENGGWIAYIDSCGAKYDVCNTIGDTLNRTLTANITHFSGYASDDPRYDQLEKEIYEKAEALEAAIGTDYFVYRANDLLRLYRGFTCVGDYCPDFSDLWQAIETILLDCWTRESNHVRLNAGAGCDGVRDLYWLWGALRSTGYNALSNWESFLSLEGTLLSDARAKMHFLADRGRQLCGRDSCAAGQEALSCVIRYVRDFGVAEQEGELLDSAAAWFTNCCTEKLTLSVDKTEIFDCALSDNDRSQLAIFMANLADAAGPIPDHEIVLVCRRDDGYGIGGQATTDESGRADIIIFMAPEGIHAKSPGRFRCVAQAFVGDHWVKSDTLTLTITRRVITMNYAYQYNMSGSSECCWQSATLSFSGIGKMAMGEQQDCVLQRHWLVRRSVNISWGCGCSDPSSTDIRSLPKCDSLPACFYDAGYTGEWKEEPAPGYSQYILRAVYVNWLYPIDGCFLEVTVNDEYGTRVDTTDNTCHALFPDRDGYYVDSALYNGGSFSPVQWDTTFAAGTSTYSASWLITFSLED